MVAGKFIVGLLVCAVGILTAEQSVFAEAVKDTEKMGEQLAQRLKSVGAPQPESPQPAVFDTMGMVMCEATVRKMGLLKEGMGSTTSCTDDQFGKTCTIQSQDKYPRGVPGCSPKGAETLVNNQVWEYVTWLPSLTVTETWACRYFTDRDNKRKVALYLASYSLERVRAAKSTAIYGETQRCLQSAFVDLVEQRSNVWCPKTNRPALGFWKRISGTSLKYDVRNINGNQKFTSNIAQPTRGDAITVNYGLASDGKTEVDPCSLGSNVYIDQYKADVEARNFKTGKMCTDKCWLSGDGIKSKIEPYWEG